MAEPVRFTRPAAERIARVVRTVEGGSRDGSGPTSQRPWDSMPGGGGGKLFRIATFTGSWATNTAKTVTFRNQTTTPNTVSAVNIFSNISLDCGTRNCAIAREGTAWYLISAQCS